MGTTPEEFKNKVGEFLDASGIDYERDVTLGGDGDSEPEERNALQEKLFKLRKKMNPDLIQELDAMSEEDVRKKIVEAEGHIHETEQAKDADEGLAELKEKAKEAAAPYNETKKTQTNIVKYCTGLLVQMGKL